MKTNRKGKIRLQRGDYRVGNFVFHEENGYIKAMAVSGIASWRISADTSIGMLVGQAMKEHYDNWLTNYAACVLSHLCIVPDTPFFEKHSALINHQVEQHPEYYGKEQPTDDKEADDKILKEEQELQEELEKRPE